MVAEGSPRQNGGAAVAPPAPETRPPANPAAPAEHHSEQVIPPNLRRAHTLTVIVVTLVFLASLAALFVIGWLPHQHEEALARKDADDVANDVPIVSVRNPVPAAAATSLTLPCDVRAYAEASLFPRTNGYLKKLYVDIQSHVTEGDLLAEIDTPEVDAQLEEAKANVDQMKATVEKANADVNLAQGTLKRYQEVSAAGGQGTVTKQEMEEVQNTYAQSVAALKQAQANVTASQKAVERLAVLQSFEKVTAPFTGIITARNYDVGALLSSSNQTAGHELFRLADMSTLRVFINVPQVDASKIKTGQPAYLVVRNYPDQKFTGLVARNAGALDPATRMLPFELDFPNRDFLLFAGMFGYASLDITDDRPLLAVPTSALIFSARGSQVAVVKDNKVHFQTIVVERDLGTQLELSKGVTADDLVITNPGERLTEGGAVRTVAAKGDAEPKRTPANAQADAH